MTAAQPFSADLARACRAFADLLELVGEDDLDAPTPCPDWTIRHLVSHVIEGNRRFTALLQQRTPRPVAPERAIATAGSLREEFLAGLPGLLAAFDAPGALLEPVRLPIGRVPGSVALQARITDILVHTWDLAGALRVASSDVPEDLAASALRFVRTRRADLPPDRFGPAQPCPAEAPFIDQLAAELGRVP
jgi:uncharacterized protein (TIGR03086 family)